MKVFLIIFLSLPFIFLPEPALSTHTSDTIDYRSGSWEEIRTMAAETDKFIMVSFIAEWCYWCRAMEETTFRDAGVVRELNENYISWRLDADLEESFAMAAKFRVTSFPTLLFFGPDASFITKKTGYIADAEEFSEKVREIAEMEDSEFPDYAFDPAVLNPGFPDFYLAAFYDEGVSEDGLFVEALMYIIDLEEEELIGEIPWSVMYKFGITAGNSGDYFISRYNEFKRRFGQTESLSHLRKVYRDKISMYAKLREEKYMLSQLNRLDKLEVDDIENEKLRFKISYYMQTQEWNKVLDQMEHHLKTSDSPNLNSVNSVSLNIYDATSDPKILSRAADLMGRVTDIHPIYPHLDTHAALLFRAGRVEEGLEVAKKAIVVGKEEGIDVSDTEILMEIYKE